MNQNGISKLEQLVREAVEGSFGRLFGDTVEPMDVATRLVQAMEDDSLRSEQVPAYVVGLNPKDYQKLLKRNPNLATDLAAATWDLAERYGLPSTAKPRIFVLEDDGVKAHAARISARHEAPGVDTTQIVARKGAGELALSALKSLDAFLIVQGKRHVALDKPLVSIGRRPDNDVVIDSPTVSRRHAQIRWRFDRFVIYDVSGRDRTKVNGEIVAESVLKPGDVIALSDALLVYAEGEERISQQRSRSEGEEHTQMLPRIDHE